MTCPHAEAYRTRAASARRMAQRETNPNMARMMRRNAKSLYALARMEDANA